MDEQQIRQRAEDFEKALKAFESGMPAPVVEASELKTCCQRWRKLRQLHPPNENKLVAMAGFSATNPSGENEMALWLRLMLLDALLHSGVLRDYVIDDEPFDAVFHAAATMPMVEEDLAEARILRHLDNLPAEEAVKAMEHMKAEGFSEADLKIDAKFLAAVRAAL